MIIRDGRAVIRSSIREYLVSEAMHCLRIPTARILSLVTGSLKVQRSWYKMNDDDTKEEGGELEPLRDVCNLGNSCGLKKCEIGPDYGEVLESTPGTIVCRISDSILRVGHIELFGYRVGAVQSNIKILEVKQEALHELELIFKHMVSREYPKFANLDH